MPPAASVSRPLRLVVFEDEPLLRSLITRTLGQVAGLEVVGAYGSPADAAEVPALAPDVLIMDIDLGPGPTGVDIGIQLRRELPAVGIVLLSNMRDPSYMLMIPPEQAGGWSYLVKRAVSDADALIRAIRGAADGMVVLDPEIVRGLMGGPKATEQLTPRARSVLELVAQGYSNAGIAKALDIAEKSVENQLNAIYRTLGIESGDRDMHARVQATLHFIRNG